VHYSMPPVRGSQKIDVAEGFNATSSKPSLTEGVDVYQGVGSAPDRIRRCLPKGPRGGFYPGALRWRPTAPCSIKNSRDLLKGRTNVHN
jgi:hypothetical protein